MARIADVWYELEVRSAYDQNRGAHSEWEPFDGEQYLSVYAAQLRQGDFVIADRLRIVEVADGIREPI